MRILTVRQPWALHIIQSGKDVENRTRNIAGNYRGPVAIHSALKADEDALRRLPGLPPNGISRVFHYGAIIGVVDLVGVHHDQSIGAHGHCCSDASWHGGTECSGGCSRWAEPGAWHLCLNNPRPLTDPIPYPGALGLRTLPDDVVARIQGALS